MKVLSPPTIKINTKGLAKAEHDTWILQYEQNDRVIRLRFQLIIIDKTYLFVGSPDFKNLKHATSLGVSYKDFALHDMSNQNLFSRSHDQSCKTVKSNRSSPSISENGSCPFISMREDDGEKHSSVNYRSIATEKKKRQMYFQPEIVPHNSPYSLDTLISRDAHQNFELIYALLNAVSSEAKAIDEMLLGIINLLIKEQKLNDFFNDIVQKEVSTTKKGDCPFRQDSLQSAIIVSFLRTSCVHAIRICVLNFLQRLISHPIP